jgi:hypothetical protein
MILFCHIDSMIFVGVMGLGKDERTHKPKNYTQGIKSKNVTKPERRYKYFVSLHDL